MSILFRELVEKLTCLPSVGEKSAQRMALHLLNSHRQSGIELANVLQNALQSIRHCEQCRNYTEASICELCDNPKRDRSKLCIVETPADVISIESTGSYRGRYFVLLGCLSPLDGIGPDEIGMQQLKQYFQTDSEISEVIFALGSSMEAKATVDYILRFLPEHVGDVSSIAYGVPMGGSLDYVDAGTLEHAFTYRNSIKNK